MKVKVLPQEERRTSKTKIFFVGKTTDVKAQRKVLCEVFEAAGLPAGTKVKYSRYAGCSCGCSDGFIVQGQTGFDIYVKEGDAE